MKNILIAIIVFFYLGIVGCQNDDGSNLINNQTVELNVIPENADIIFHRDNLIHTIDEHGENLTQITFDASYTFEHVAVSYDRTKIICNYFSDLSIGSQSSKLLLYDLVSKTVTNLLPEFAMAGNGGVDWDKNGYIYFAAVREIPFPNASTIDEFKVNAGANDIYRMKYDGTHLQNLTNTEDCGEADVSVSIDSQFITYMGTNITEPTKTFTEIWKRNVNGSDVQLLFTGGEDRISSVHDPELSPDGDYVIFSQVNNSVAPVFPENSWANTAHDIIKVKLNDSANPEVITQPGPISIAPDWRKNKVLFLEITDKTNPPHAGLATINMDGTGYKLILNATNIGKWIPE